MPLGRILLATLLCAVPATATAQVRIMRSGGVQGAEALLQDSPADFGVSGWRVGQWARYSISENVGGPMPMGRFRTVQVVGRSGERFWVEVGMEFSGMVTGAAPTQKYLLAFGPIREQVGQDYYTLMPDSALLQQRVLRAGTGARQRSAFPEGWTRVGEEQLTVAGGAFRTVHWRKGGEDLWTATDAGPVGVVKYTSADMQIELAGRGDTGARSRVPAGGN
jgi:hypothetical protein